jgi:formate hydrogenlyase transcriptional activator
VILSNNGVLPDALPTARIPDSRTHDQGHVVMSPATTTLRDSERALILQTLAEAGWVIGGPAGAATKLGLKRTTLIHKMKKLGISRPYPQSGRAATTPALRDGAPLPQLS